MSRSVDLGREFLKNLKEVGLSEAQVGCLRVLFDAFLDIRNLIEAQNKILAEDCGACSHDEE